MPTPGAACRPEQQIRLRHFSPDWQAPYHPPVVRRHTAPLGVQARLAPRTFAHRSGRGLRRSRRRRIIPQHRWRPHLARVAGLRGHGTGPQWQPGAGGLCLHTIILDPKDPKRIFIAISAAGAFRTDNGGATWRPINRGLRSPYIPDQDAEIGHCVHHVAMHPDRPASCTCRNIGTSCAVTTPETPGRKSAEIFPATSAS